MPSSTPLPVVARVRFALDLVSRSGYGEHTITYDGVGLPAERDGSGLRIVQALAAQIEGDLQLLRQAGTRWILRFLLGIGKAKRLSAKVGERVC